MEIFFYSYTMAKHIKISNEEQRIDFVRPYMLTKNEVKTIFKIISNNTEFIENVDIIKKQTSIKVNKNDKRFIVTIDDEMETNAQYIFKIHEIDCNDDSKAIYKAPNKSEKFVQNLLKPILDNATATA